MGQDEREGRGRVSHVCCPTARARGFRGTHAVPLLPVSQSGGPFLLPLLRKNIYFFFKKKETREPGLGRRTHFAEPHCSSDLFKPLIFPLP